MNVASFAAFGGMAGPFDHSSNLRFSSFSEMNSPERPSHRFSYSELNWRFTLRRDVHGLVAAIRLTRLCEPNMSLSWQSGIS